MTEARNNFGISGSTLKLIAIITMLVDHTGATVIRAILRHPAVTASPELRMLWQDIYNISRDIGRIAFPIFCFLIVEGFLHTRNVKKYAMRLFLFALISEIPYDIALKGSWYYPDKQNVYFTLLIGLLVLMGIAFLTRGMTQHVFLAILPIALGMWLANFIDTDYNFKGVFLIAILYLLQSNRLYLCMSGAAAVAWELPAPVGFLPVYLYNGTRGRQMKYFFYWFYPVHLMVLYVIANYVIPAL